MDTNVAVSVLCIAVAGVAAQWLAWRMRLPAIVLLFAVGLTVGPALEILQPVRDFGGALRPLIGLAVAVVVFEGGLALNFRELRAAGEGVLRLTALALPISFVLASAAAYLLTGMPLGIAVLFGAITVVTGPTVVLPLLRHTRLQPRAASFLKWEAIVNDPVGALLAAIVLAALLANGHGGTVALALKSTAGLAVAVGLGVGAGFLVRAMFVNDQAPEPLRTPILLALVFGVYAVSNLVMDEAGLAAATIFGITLANLRIPGLSELARFKEALVVLLVSALFIVLTASLGRGLLSELSWRLLLLTLAMLFVIRPLAIVLATWRSNLTWQERVLAGWIAPRGIVAAAVAGVASTQLAADGIAGANELMPAIFAIIAATMVLHGFTLAPVARVLGLSLGDLPTLGIVGSTGWTIEVADTLRRAGIAVLLIDTYPGALAGARARDLPVLQVELLSEHGEHTLDSFRLDYLLFATPDDVYNSMVSIRLAPELGRHRVFQVASEGFEHDEWEGHSREWRGEVAGSPALSFAEFRRRHRLGWKFAVTEQLDDLDRPPPEDAIQLLRIRRNGALAMISVEGSPASPNTGDRLLMFVPPPASVDESSTEAVKPAQQSLSEL